MPRALAPASLLALAAVSLQSPALAQSWSLTWRAPAACPGEGAVRAQVEALLGDSARATGAAMDVTVTRRARWQAEITTRTADRRGARTLDADTCAELGEAVAVILAWMIDPTLAAPAITPPPPALPAPIVPPSPPDAPAATPAATPVAATPVAATPVAAPPVVAAPVRPAPAPPRAPPPWEFHLGVAVRGDLGALPGFTLGLELWITLARGPWRASLEGSWRPSAEATLPSSAAGGRFDLWTLGVRGCHAWRRDALVSPAACAVVEGGGVGAEGFGVDRVLPIAEPWIAVGAGAALDLRVTRWLVAVAALDGVVPLVRPDFILEPARGVFQSAPVTLRARIGAAVHF